MSGLLIVIILLWLFRNIGRAVPRRHGMFFGPVMGGFRMHHGHGPRPFGGFGAPFRGGGGGRVGGFGSPFRGGGGGFTRGGGGGRFR